MTSRSSLICPASTPCRRNRFTGSGASVRPRQQQSAERRNQTAAPPRTTPPRSHRPPMQRRPTPRDDGSSSPYGTREPSSYASTIHRARRRRHRGLDLSPDAQPPSLPAPRGDRRRREPGSEDGLPVQTRAGGRGQVLVGLEAYRLRRGPLGGRFGQRRREGRVHADVGVVGQLLGESLGALGETTFSE